jgi:hypothetical protein
MKAFVVLFTLIFLVSCKPDNDVIGKWRLVEIDFSDHLATLEGEEKARYQEIIEKQRTMLEETFFNFEANNVLQVIKPQKDGSGQIMQIEKWILSKNQDSLEMINANREMFLVNLKDRNKMILSSVDSPKRKLIMTRVN